MLDGKFQGAGVAAGQEFALTRSTAAPHRTHGVDDIFGGEPETWRDPRLSRRTAHTGTHFGDRAAGLEQLWAGRPVDGALNAAAAEHRLVGGVHDRFDIKRCDIGLKGGNAVNIDGVFLTSSGSADSTVFRIEGVNCYPLPFHHWQWF